MEDRPTRILYVLLVPWQHRSHELKRYQKEPFLYLTDASIAPLSAVRSESDTRAVEEGFPVEELNLRREGKR